MHSFKAATANARALPGRAALMVAVALYRI